MRTPFQSKSVGGLLAAGVVTLALGAPGAAAQDPNDPFAPQPPVPETGEQDVDPLTPQDQDAEAHSAKETLVKSSSVIGAAVKDSLGARVGVARDVVIAPDGSLLAVLVEVDDGLGLLPVPPSALEATRDRTDDLEEPNASAVCEIAGLRLVNRTREQLDESPRCTSSSPLDEALLVRVYGHFGLPLVMPRTVDSFVGAPDAPGVSSDDPLTPETEGLQDGDEHTRVQEDGGLLASDLKAALATEVNGEDVVNSEDEQLGKIGDLVLQFDQAEVAYAVLESGGMLGIGEKRFAVPYAQLSQDLHTQSLFLDIDRAQLEKADGFTVWPESADDTLFTPARFSHVGEPARRTTARSTSGG